MTCKVPPLTTRGANISVYFEVLINEGMMLREVYVFCINVLRNILLWVCILSY